jgi:tetratricopeptide (TPR) repeat protein
MRTLVISALALSLSASLACAAAGGGTTSSGATGTPSGTNANNSPLKLNCKNGEVVKIVKKNGKDVKECVKVTGSLVPDDDLYHQGWVLAKAGQYDWAIEVLSSVKDQTNPDVLTMLGYSNRKAGRVDVGFNFYNKALAINPDHVRAHEYLGEGLVAQGKIEQAKVQLGEVKRICGNTTCEEYQDLSKAILDGKEDAL